jgi:hypothetical protein
MRAAHTRSGRVALHDRGPGTRQVWRAPAPGPTARGYPNGRAGTTCPVRLPPHADLIEDAAVGKRPPARTPAAAGVFTDESARLISR